MKSRTIAAVVAAAGMANIAHPAPACPNGNEPVWIQGNKVCKFNTLKFDCKPDMDPQLK